MDENLITYPLPIRDLQGAWIKIPKNISLEEVDRIYKILLSLCVDLEERVCKT